MNQDNGKMDGAPEVHVGRLSCLTSEVKLTYCVTSGALTIFFGGALRWGWGGVQSQPPPQLKMYTKNTSHFKMCFHMAPVSLLL